MSRITCIILFFFAHILITGCVSVPTAENSSIPTQRLTQIITATPRNISTLTSTSSVCKGRDLLQANEPITTIFKDGLLEQISLGEILHGSRLEFSPDGSKLAIPIYHGSKWEPDGVYIFDTAKGQLLCILPIKNEGAIFEGIAFSPDGLLSASLYFDGTILLRNSNTGEVIRELRTVKYDSPGWIYFNNNGSYLVTSGYSQPARIWNVNTGKLIMSVDSVRVALSPDGNSLAVPDENTIKIVSIPSKEVLSTINYSEAKDYFLFSVDGDFLYLLNSYSEVTVWNIHNGELIKKLNPSTNYEEFGWEKEIRLTLSADGSRLLMENPSKIIVWDTHSWQELLNGRSADIDELVPIADAVISPDGRTAVINYSYNVLRFWRISE